MILEQINNFVKNKETQIVIMSASWCGPCKTLSKTVDKIKTEHSELADKIHKVDVDDNPELVDAYNIFSVPTVLYIHEGVIDITTGIQSEEKLLSFFG